MKPKIFSFLKDNNEHKKIKGVNRNVDVSVSHNEYNFSFLVDNNEHKKIKGVNRNVDTSVSQQNYIVLFWWQNYIVKLQSAELHCLVLMTKYISKTVDMTD